MSYFKQFPTTSYDVNKDGVLDDVVDIFRYVDVKDNAITDLATYTWYDIKDGERPDVVSQKLYGTPKYYWTFFVVNDSLKHGLEDWPLSHHELEKFLEFNFDSNSVLKLKTKVQPYNREAIYPAEQGVGLDGLHQTETLPLYNFENTLNGLLLVEDVVIKNVDNSELALIQNYDSANNQLSIKKGTVSKINLEDAGSSYVMPPTVIFSKNTTGDTATALCAINEDGSIGLIEITSPGSGYQTVPTIQLFNGPDVPAELEISCDDESLINESVNIIKQGRGYRRIPTLIVSAPVISGGTRATAECSLSIDGEIETVTITNRGTGYSMDYPPFITIVVDEDSQGSASANIVDDEWISSLNRFSLSTAFINAQNNAASYKQFQVQGINYALQTTSETGYVNLSGDTTRRYYPRFEESSVKSKVRAASPGSGEEVKPANYKTVANKCSIDFAIEVSVVGFNSNNFTWNFDSKGPITYQIVETTPGTYGTFVTYDTSGGMDPENYTTTQLREDWPQSSVSGEYEVQIDEYAFPTVGYAGNMLNGVKYSIGSSSSLPNAADLKLLGPDISDLLTSIASAKAHGPDYFEDNDYYSFKYNSLTGKIDAIWHNFYEEDVYTYGVFDVVVTNTVNSSDLNIFFNSTIFPTYVGSFTVSGYVKVKLTDFEIPFSSGSGGIPESYSVTGSYSNTSTSQTTAGSNEFQVGSQVFNVDDVITVNGYSVNKLAYYTSGGIGSTGIYDAVNYFGNNVWSFTGMDETSIIKSWNYSYATPASTSKPYFIPQISGDKYTYYQLTFVLKTFEYDGTTVGAEVIDPLNPNGKYYTGIFNTSSTGVAEVALGFDNFQGIGPIPTGYIKIAFLDKVNSVTPYKYDLTTEWYDPYMKWIKTYYPRIYDTIAEEPQSVLPDDTISPQLFALNAERVLIFDVEHQETLGRNGLCHYESEDGKYSSSGDVSSVDVVPISESEYALNVNLPSPFASVPETPTFVTVAECIEKENRAKTKIRVVKPEHINDFATSFRSLIQS